MAEYKLNDAAKQDLARIYRRGLERHGEAQADRYYYAFFRRFDQIAEQPFLYQAVEHIKSGYRRSVCGQESIYYRVVDGVPEIMRILGRQDLSSELE
ncbi:MAG: type II toxin-antitoxin system RelE/ParE family toxin [Rhizobiaceae bacterium]|nr:type II toxin-antitoxin system RelE/ParE family toxin [Rhizobiaceae bacterium]